MDATKKVNPVNARKWLAATKCNEHKSHDASVAAQTAFRDYTGSK
jgi:hypothetical protein